MSAALPTMRDLLAALEDHATTGVSQALAAGDLAESLARFAAKRGGEKWANLSELLDAQVMAGVFDVD